jgi:hypothetical protein
MASNMDSLQEPRSVYLSFMIDANRINARQADPDMNQIEAWHANGVIDVLMPEAAYEEARAGGDPRRARKVSRHVFSMTMDRTQGEQEALREIERLRFPAGARTQNEQNDVEIVFNARKYKRILITADGGSNRQPGGMLGNRAPLADLGATIMTAAEAVVLIRKKVAGRDDRARRSAREEGTPLPEWVGRD